jgi:hypothetical protein
MPSKPIRIAAFIGTAGLACAAFVLTAAPANAAIFPVTSFAEFTAALAVANVNGQPDVIAITVPADVEWGYAGTQDVLEDLTLEPQPGSGTVTFHSSDSSAVTLAAGVQFAATGVDLTADQGSGIAATAGADITLDTVGLRNSGVHGLDQVGGTLTALRVVAIGNDTSGLNVQNVATATLTTITASSNGTGVDISVQGGSAIINGLEAMGNSGFGLRAAADGGTVEVSDAHTAANGGPFVLGGGVAVSAIGGAEVTLTRLNSEQNGAFNGGGLWLEFLEEQSTVTVRDSTITANRALIGGGGISTANSIGEYGIGSGSQLLIENTLVAENEAQDAAGGIAVVGISADSSFVLSRSTVRDNRAATLGGGLAIVGVGGADPTVPTVLIDSSTISGNSTLGAVGGVVLECDGSVQPGVVRIVDTTVSGNQGVDLASAIAAGCEVPDRSVTLELFNSTVTANGGGTDGSVLLFSANADVRNSIIGGNGDDSDLSIDAASDLAVAYSLVELPDPAAAPIVAAGTGNLTGAAPGIGPLADNGGPTWTHLPLENGNVVEAGDPAFAPPPALDQRGEPRVSGRLDIGSVELTHANVLPATGGSAPWWLAVVAVGALVVGARSLRLSKRPS